MCVDFRRKRYAYDKGQEARRVCAARCCIRRVSQGLNDLAGNFSCLNFRGFYFRVSVVGHENRENLDLAKISRYTVCENVFL